MGLKCIDSLDQFDQPHFDYVNAEQVFEHITDPLETLKRLRAIVKPGGVIHIAVPNAADCLKRLLSAQWKATNDAFHPLEHINSFTHPTLEKLGTFAGLTVIDRPDRSVGLMGSTIAGLAGKLRSKSTSMYFRA